MSTVVFSLWLDPHWFNPILQEYFTGTQGILLRNSEHTRNRGNISHECTGSKWYNYNNPKHKQSCAYLMIPYNRCRRCSNYIFILHLTRGFNILRKDNCKPRRETFKFWKCVRLILEILRYHWSQWTHHTVYHWPPCPLYTVINII